MPVLFPGL